MSINKLSQVMKTPMPDRAAEEMVAGLEEGDSAEAMEEAVMEAARVGAAMAGHGLAGI